MKVVKNTCYGGFGLSIEAVVELLKMNSELINKKEIKNYLKECDENPENLNEFLEIRNDALSFPQPIERQAERWDSISYEDRELYYTFSDKLMDFEKGLCYGVDRRMFDNRHHPDLIEVVEKLGEDSYGDAAELTIKEIPDSIGEDYIIRECDGMETIAEPHRTW